MHSCFGPLPYPCQSILRVEGVCVTCCGKKLRVRRLWLRFYGFRHLGCGRNSGWSVGFGLGEACGFSVCVRGRGGTRLSAQSLFRQAGSQVSWGDVLRMDVKKFVCLKARSYACTCVQTCMRVYTQNSSVAEEA